MPGRTPKTPSSLSLQLGEAIGETFALSLSPGSGIPWQTRSTPGTSWCPLTSPGSLLFFFFPPPADLKAITGVGPYVRAPRGVGVLLPGGHEQQVLQPGGDVSAAVTLARHTCTELGAFSGLGKGNPHLGTSRGGSAPAAPQPWGVLAPCRGPRLPQRAGSSRVTPGLGHCVSGHGATAPNLRKREAAVPQLPAPSQGPVS